MRLPNSPRKLKKLPDTWEILKRIEKTLGLTDRQMADMLLMTAKEYSHRKAVRASIRANHIFSVSEHVQIHFDAILTGEIDYQALAQHHSGNKSHVPERYAKSSLGRRRTSLCFLNFIEEEFGWEERNDVLRRFQLNEAIYANPDAPISFQAGADILDYLHKYKLDESMISKIGVRSFLSTCTETVRKELLDCRGVAELYLKMCTDLVPKYFERNFLYAVSKVSAHECTLIARPNPELQEDLGTKTVGNSATAMVRTGLAAAYPAIVNLPMAAVSQTHCIYKGDAEIRYKIDFSRALAATQTRQWQAYKERSVN